MIPDGGIAAVGKRAGAPVADARRVVGVATEDPRCDLGHEAAVVVADAVPYHVVTHFGLRRSGPAPPLLNYRAVTGLVGAHESPSRL